MHLFKVNLISIMFFFVFLRKTTVHDQKIIVWLIADF